MALACIYRHISVNQIFQFSAVSLNFSNKKWLGNFQVIKNISLSHKLFKRELEPKAPINPSADPFAKPPKKHKPLTSPQITLIINEDNVTMVTLEMAEKLAKRRNLKLVKIVDFDTKTERPTYKMMTSQQFFEESAQIKEKKKNKTKFVKENKLFTISSKIGDNDVSVKINQMNKALKKRHGVQVVISCEDNPSRAEEIADAIEKELKDLIHEKVQVTKLKAAIKMYLGPKFDNRNENKHCTSEVKDNIVTNEESLPKTFPEN